MSCGTNWHNAVIKWSCVRENISNIHLRGNSAAPGTCLRVLGDIPGMQRTKGAKPSTVTQEQLQGTSLIHLRCNCLGRDTEKAIS